MDLADARDSILRAPDVPALSNVLLALLNLVGPMEYEIARLRQRIEVLERGELTIEKIARNTDGLHGRLRAALR